MTRGTKIGVASALLWVLGLGALAFRARQGPGANVKGPFTIRTWTRKDCSVTPWTIAEKLGFLAAEGLRVEYTGETQPALRIPSVLRGDNDVAEAHPNTLAVAKAGGAKISAVQEEEVEPTDPERDVRLRHMWWFVNPKKHGEVTSFADLAKISGSIKVSTIASDTCIDFETNLLADKFGISRARFEWITMPEIQAVQSLRQGLIDVSGVHATFYKAMEDTGARKIADSSETGLGASAGLTYWYFRDEFIDRHPREVAAFARAIRNAQAWANAHPEAAIQLTQEAIGVSVTGSHFYSENWRVDETLTAPWIAELEASGVIPKGKVTPANLVTHQIESINAEVHLSRIN